MKFVRGAQFAEDAGPMSHPIRPDSYLKMDNFYTGTVYRKVRASYFGTWWLGQKETDPGSGVHAKNSHRP